MKIIKLFIFNFIVLFFITFSCFSEIINKIKINGNKQIQLETIINKIGYKAGKDYSPLELNLMQKKLYETGFFENIEFKINDQILVVNVKENPIVDFFYIYGDKNKERIDKLYDILELRSGNLYSDFKLLGDLSKINQIYKYQGFYNVKTEPTIKKVDNDKVNISIKILKGEQFKVNKVFFIGEKYFKSSVLLDAISTTEDAWWRFLSSTSLLNEDRIDVDKNLLKNFYLNEGFYDIQIVTAKIEILDDNLANVLFSINSGKSYSFGEVSYNQTFLNSNIKNYLNKETNKLKNSTYSKLKILKLKNSIFDLLVFNKIENIDFKIDEKKQNNKIDIYINFFNKKLPIVKDILVKGNSITEEKVIRNNLIFSEGDTLSDYKITKSNDNMNSVGIFKSSKIKRVNVSENEANIEVEVVEQPTGSIMGGVGVGTNDTSISFAITEKNLFGKNITLESDINLGTQKVYGNIFFSDPDFNDSGRLVKNNFFVQDTNYDSVGYESSMFGDNLFTSYDLYENINLDVGIGFDYDKITAASSASALYKSLAGNYITYKTFYGIANDKRDKKYKTTDGYITGFKQTLALPGSDIIYLKNSFYNNYYNSINKDYVLSLKTGFSSINTLDNNNVKLSNRLFLSSNNLRGFEPRGIGPVDGSDHVGGNYSIYGSLSSTFPNPMPEKWNANTAVFLDAGNVWGVDYDSSKDSNKLRSSFGVGLDWLSPLGPVSFVFSNTLSKESTDEDQSFSFRIGSAF